MTELKTFTLLRKLLKALGLSAEAIDDIIQFIQDLLTGDDAPAEAVRLPYHLRDDFLSPAEQSFYLVLQQTVGQHMLICPKVSLGNLFFAKTDDRGQNQAYTNRISRKHIDFLLCDRLTVQPLLGIELDDRSHQRPGRQERDRFVDQVFRDAGLPLSRFPVQHSYNTTELATTLGQIIDLAPSTAKNGPGHLLKSATRTPPQPAPADRPPTTATPTAAEPADSTDSSHLAPDCPKCGSQMVLRTAKRGANQGQKFWAAQIIRNAARLWPMNQISKLTRQELG